MIITNTEKKKEKDYLVITESQEIQHCEFYRWQHKMETLDLYEW